MKSHTHGPIITADDDYKQMYEKLLSKYEEQQETIQMLKEECSSLKTSLDQALKQSELFRLMGETLPYGIWMCDSEGKAKYMSQSFLDLLEMTLEEAQEFGWSHRLKPGTEEAMFGKWLDCEKQAKTGTMNISFLDLMANTTQFLQEESP